MIERFIVIGNNAIQLPVRQPSSDRIQDSVDIQPTASNSRNPAETKALAMTQLLSAPEVSAMLSDGNEIAFIDVREIVPFGSGHPLLAANIPLSGMERSIGNLVPRRNTRVVLTDGGEGHAALAAERLERLGYTNLAILDGGAPAWEAASEALFPEIEVPAKGFGAFARINGEPNFISPPELDQALKSDEDWIVLDSRPNKEFRWGNIPGGINVPGADLVRSFHDLVPNPGTKVVVNCMSGTRGILGGLSLVAAGVPNEVRVLFHGTRGWLLDDLELEKNSDRAVSPISPEARRVAVDRARHIAENAGIERIDSAALKSWQDDSERTTYLFDVRTLEEFETGHIAGSRCAPEGRLPMSFERYFATLNARIVLIDDDTVRATVTALWMIQMGWGEIAVLVDGLQGGLLRKGPEPMPEMDFGDIAVPEITARQLETQQQRQPARIIDVGWSDAYQESHIPGAVWCSRLALPNFLETQTYDGATVLTSEDGTVAKLAASDLDSSLLNDLSILTGGNATWRDAGLELATGLEDMASPRDDHWLASSERPGDTRENVVSYLEWEITLFDDIERGGRVPYKNLIWN
jgi:rhodanese-related sulfurtransferase